MLNSYSVSISAQLCINNNKLALSLSE